MIFSHVLYRLSYLGTYEAGAEPPRNYQDTARRVRRARRAAAG